MRRPEGGSSGSQVRQLSLFFFLAFLISWLLWTPLWLKFFGVEAPSLPLQHAVGGLGPACSAFVCWLIFRKPVFRGGSALSGFRRSSVPYLLAALFLPLLLQIISVVMLHGPGTLNIKHLLTTEEFSDFSVAEFFVYNFVFFGLGEEIGWRGYALPLLQSRSSARISALLITIFWAAWHIPLFLNRPGYISMDASGVAGWIFSLLTGSVLLSFLYNRSGGSILICAIFHCTIDIAFTAKASDEMIVQMLGISISLLGIAAFFLLPRSEKLSSS